jgi:hypothetical protein
MNRLDELNARILANLYTVIKPCCVSDAPDAHTVWIKVDEHCFALDGYRENETDAKAVQLMIGKLLLSLIQKYVT